MTEVRALIIDDNSSDRALALRELKKLFPRLKYEEVIDRTSFTEVLERDNFNIVITDYQLGWTTGLKILHQIKEQKPECPVIMFTGTGSEEIAVSAMKAGLDDYVIKSPKHYVRLAAAVRSAWQRWEQKKALQEFKQSYYRFFERVPLGLYRLNPQGEIIEANSTLAKMLGYKPQHDLKRTNLLQYHLEPETYLSWQQQLNQNRAIAEFEGQMKTKDGQSIWVRHHAIAVKNTHNDLVGYEGAVVDLTPNKQAELEKIELLNRERQARKEAETVNRIKDEFLATLSHELRTPLNAIVGWVQLLRGGMMSEAQINKAIEVIDRNAKAQNQLINDLLDVSRIIRGTMSLTLKPTDLFSVVMASLDTVRPGAVAKSIEIAIEIESNLPKVNADEERLQQVFWNLLINSIKFTPIGGRITINSVITEELVAIAITDTGQGITPDVLPYVFDRFRQAETKSSTRTKGGLGLGLAIVRHLVEMHGGRVTANSAGLGKGATFTVELPIMQSGIRYRQQASFSDNSNSLPSFAGLTVLVVEDETDTREIIALILEKCQAKVVVADSVERALIQYQQHQPDVLISDISMPTQDGYVLIRQIRQAENERVNLLAIALTANVREEDKQQALKAGFDLHLSKPIEPFKLVESLAQLIQPQ